MPLWRITHEDVEMGDLLDGYIVVETKKELSVTAMLRRHALRTFAYADPRDRAHDEKLAAEDRPMTWARLAAGPHPPTPGTIFPGSK